MPKCAKARLQQSRISKIFRGGSPNSPFAERGREWGNREAGGRRVGGRGWKKRRRGREGRKRKGRRSPNKNYHYTVAWLRAMQSDLRTFNISSSYA